MWNNVAFISFISFHPNTEMKEIKETFYFILSEPFERGFFPDGVLEPEFMLPLQIHFHTFHRESSFQFYYLRTPLYTLDKWLSKRKMPYLRGFFYLCTLRKLNAFTF